MTLKLANLTLLILFPLACFSPLMRAGLNLPLFGLKEISVISGLQALWESDVILALLVTAFALMAPYLKTIGLALVHFRMASPRILGAMHILGKLAMADVFLIALYIVVVKGVGLAKVETGWGLYFFSGCHTGLHRDFGYDRAFTSTLASCLHPSLPRRSKPLWPNL